MPWQWEKSWVIVHGGGESREEFQTASFIQSKQKLSHACLLACLWSTEYFYLISAILHKKQSYETWDRAQLTTNIIIWRNKKWFFEKPFLDILGCVAVNFYFSNEKTESAIYFCTMCF